MSNYKAVGFIPARSGSKRIQDKNIRCMAGHPLLAYAIGAALESGVFDSVICVTDDPEYAEIARHYGAEIPCLRPGSTAGDTSPDIEWVLWILEELSKQGRSCDAFSILRPTSPFRQAGTIKRAWDKFVSVPASDSLRAVEKCKQHPGKMWVVGDNNMSPVMPFKLGGVPWHSNQYAALPEIYVQNASLEIAWTATALNKKSISGDIVIPFISEGYEGFDINQPEDWVVAEYLLANGKASLPTLKQNPYFQ